jgi:putative Mn2+ efflux pump MntP
MSYAKWIEYGLLNLSAAAAIAIDACVLVILKFRDFKDTRVTLKWASAVGLTHVTFPMVGFIGGWVVIQRYHLATVVYSIGAILLCVLICFVLRESIDPGEPNDLLPDTSKVASAAAFWLPVFYVSIDALLAGPGKVVLLDRYPDRLAWLSFFIIGFLVAVFTFFAGAVSRVLHKRWIADKVGSPAKLATALTVGIIGEIVLFSFFMAWSFAEAVESIPGTNVDPPLSYVAVAAIVVAGSISLYFLKRIRAAQLRKVEAAITALSKIQIQPQ